MLILELLLSSFQLLDNNSISRITERNTITRYTAFYPAKPSWGRKPNKNFLNIDFQYNAKIKDKTPRITKTEHAPLSPSFGQL
jgi:hypothetical protein